MIYYYVHCLSQTFLLKRCNHVIELKWNLLTFLIPSYPFVNLDCNEKVDTKVSAYDAFIRYTQSQEIGYSNNIYVSSLLNHFFNLDIFQLFTEMELFLSQLWLLLRSDNN